MPWLWTFRRIPAMSVIWFSVAKGRVPVAAAVVGPLTKKRLGKWAAAMPRYVSGKLVLPHGFQADEKSVSPRITGNGGAKEFSDPVQQIMASTSLSLPSAVRIPVLVNLSIGVVIYSTFGWVGFEVAWAGSESPATWREIWFDCT